MTRRSGLVAGFRLAMGLAAAPLVGLAAGCGGSGMSKYNEEGFSREFEKPKTAPPPPKAEKEDPDDPRARRKKKLAAG